MCGCVCERDYNDCVLQWLLYTLMCDGLFYCNVHKLVLSRKALCVAFGIKSA